MGDRALKNNLFTKLMNLGYKFPIDVQTDAFFKLNENDIENYMKYSYPFTSSKIVKLIEDFLKFKLEFGSEVEKEFYKNFTVFKFLNRILKKRALVFDSLHDRWLLRNGQQGSDLWSTIGTDEEGQINSNLIMRDYLTYDELEISSLLCMSIYTPFINKGHSRNRAIDDNNNHEKNGIVICQTGPRTQKTTTMEWKFLIIDPSQNTTEFGYGYDNDSLFGNYMKIWASFYEVDYFPRYDEVVGQSHGSSDIYLDSISGLKKENRFIKLENYKNIYLDSFLYKKRIKYFIELFLQEANARAMAICKKAVCFVIPIGSEWFVSEIQNKIMTNVYLDSIEETKYEHISDIHFHKFADNYDIGTYLNGINLYKNGMFPSENLRNPDKILIRNTDWNSNSYIGNEYYENNLSNSDASNSACSSFISYIGNPDINNFGKIYLY